MNAAFYLAAAVAIAATVLAISRSNAVHALLYLVVSLLAVSVVLYTLGAPFAAALEVIVYAGAIMVLFVFVVMMLNLGGEAARVERRWIEPRIWIGPAVLAAIVAAELCYALATGGVAERGAVIEPKQVGMALFGPYLLAVELASMLLLAGLVGAYHIGRRSFSREVAGPPRGE
ncbi:MAG: NADH-quinone oxidoreductase subunit J [Steroidobacteraceae bacterium]